MVDPILTYQTTSCGKVDANFIEEMHNCLTPRSSVNWIYLAIFFKIYIII